MKLSIVIPAHNEDSVIESTINGFSARLIQEEIEHEFIIVNDNSTDKTQEILEKIAQSLTSVKPIVNSPPNGFGFAVCRGLENASGDYVAVVMADASDDPDDLIKFYQTAIDHKLDAVFGHRFMKGGEVIDYPLAKYVLNRFTNWAIALLFTIRYTDVTNAFKIYKKETLEGLKPYLSHHFNLTVELPLKVIVRGYSYRVLPNRWTNRKAGVSKLKIKEMGSRYWFIILYCLIEKWLSVSDYKKH